MLSFVVRPNARIGAPYFAKFVVRESMPIPDACAAIARESKTVPYSSAGILASPIALIPIVPKN